VTLDKTYEMKHKISIDLYIPVTLAKIFFLYSMGLGSYPWTARLAPLDDLDSFTHRITLFSMT
jgi:hypothetical protein